MSRPVLALDLTRNSAGLLEYLLNKRVNEQSLVFNYSMLICELW
jgi:hypothetical protein